MPFYSLLVIKQCEKCGFVHLLKNQQLCWNYIIVLCTLCCFKPEGCYKTFFLTKICMFFTMYKIQ